MSANPNMRIPDQQLRSLELYEDGCIDVTPERDTDDGLGVFRGVLNGLRVVSHVALWACMLYVLSGCANVRPLSEYQHVSHANDGLGGPGFDTLSLGVRWRPYDGVTVDLLEGYSPNGLDGQQEVFTGRVTVEF